MSSAHSFRLILGSLPQEGRRQLLWLAVLTVLGGLFEFGLLASLFALLREWMGGAEQQGAGSAFGLFVAAAIAAGLVRFALLSRTQRIAFDTGHRLIVAVQRRVLARDWLTHASAPASGPLAAMQLTEQWLYSTLLPLLQAGGAAILATGIFAALLWIDASAALVAGGLLAFLFLAANLAVRSRLRLAGNQLDHGFEARIAAVQENVGALRELILAGARGIAAERFRVIDRRLADARVRMQVAQGLPRIVVESVGLTVLAAVAWWLTGRQGGIGAALPTLAALALGAQRLLPLLQTVSHSLNALASAEAIQRRIAALLGEPDLAERPPPPPLPFGTDIAFTNVSFSYAGRDEPALSHVDLRIRRGERVALMGPNGSGKSTLADLVMGLLLPAEGKLLIDGRPLTPDCLAAWQRNVAHVPQSPFLLDASLEANIAFMDPAPDRARVCRVVQLVGLDAFVAQLPQGLATRVGDRGQLLSGGQRQRLALARALYAPAPLLVLDEATSALDPDSEAHVLQALDELGRGGTTILVIAHRETMLRGCDRVVRLEAGRLVSA